MISAEAHTPVDDPVMFRCKCGAGFAQRGLLVEHIVSEIVNAAIVDTSDVDPVSDSELEPVEDNKPTVDPVESAPVAVVDPGSVAVPEPEPVAAVVEPEPETTEIPEVPPQTNTDARVVRVSSNVIPLGVAAKDFEPFQAFNRRPRAFRDAAGRKRVYVCFTDAECVVAVRDGYTWGTDAALEREVGEYLNRHGWTLAA